MDNITLFSSKVWLSADTSDKDALYAKIAICDFSVNGNGVRIDRDNIESWISTLQNQPLVGKIMSKFDGTKDFTGHNARIVSRKDADGNEYKDIEFDTSAFGTIVDVAIEEIDGVECIVATAKIWKRFVDACQLIIDRINEGSLNTSWEIAAEEYEVKDEDSGPVRTIKKGRFKGHALLGKAFAPAYPISQILEVASLDTDDVLAAALIGDIMALETPETRRDEMNKTKPTVKEEVVLSAEETAALTMYDLRNRVEAACTAASDKYCWVQHLFPETHTVWCAFSGRSSELEYLLFTYSVDAEDNVTVSEPTPVVLTVSLAEMSEKVTELTSAIAESASEIKTLEATVTELAPYREAHEKAQKEAAIAEMRQYAENTGEFTAEELAEGNIFDLISALDKPAIDAEVTSRIISRRTASKEAAPITIVAAQVKPVIQMPTPKDKGEAFRQFINR